MQRNEDSGAVDGFESDIKDPWETLRTGKCLEIWSEEATSPDWITEESVPLSFRSALPNNRNTFEEEASRLVQSTSIRPSQASV